MQNHKTPEEVKTAVLERKLASIERSFNELKYLKIQSIIKELRDLKIENLICIYIEAKLKNKTNYLPDHQVAAIEDLDDLVNDYNKLSKLDLPF